MSAQEERLLIIQENIPKLIKSLTGFDETDENYVLCEQFAWSKIRHHRNLSVNSHEIKRRMEGLFEKFQVANYAKYASRLNKYYKTFVNNPICIGHYETDVQWSVMNFLLDLSYNPVGALSRNLRASINKEDHLQNTILVESDAEDTSYWTEVLKQDDIPCNSRLNEESDELSEWSDSDFEDNEGDIVKVGMQKQISNKIEENFQQYFPGIQPPKKLPHYELFDVSKSKNWLYENVQNSWWTNCDAVAEINSDFEAANFCEIWNQHLAAATNNMIKSDAISTTTEYCLLREIMWMFLNPVSCKFFLLENDEIKVSPNVSLPSTSLNSMQIFLQKFTRPMTIMYRLKSFCDKVNNPSSSLLPPHTYECYVNAVQQILQPFVDVLLKYEKNVLSQNSGDINTVLKLLQDLIPYFNLLNFLYEIHTYAILDWSTNPYHICSAHLLAGLYTKCRLSGSRIQYNTALSIFLVTLRVYLEMIDVWWTEGRLDDPRNEFLIEKNKNNESYESINRFTPRLFTKNKRKSFYISPNLSKVIETDPIIKILLEHSIQAGYILNTLYSLNRMNILKVDNNGDSNDSLYELFMNNFLTTMRNFHPKTETRDNENDCSNTLTILSSQSSTFSSSSKPLDSFRQEILEDGDELLLQAFEEAIFITEKYMIGDSNTTPADVSPTKFKASNELFDLMTIDTDLIIPLEQFVERILSEILDCKITMANKLVVQMYHDELHVLKHLQNIRKILLLEDNDIMYAFYTKLFEAIEAQEDWIHPHSLTAKLEDIVCFQYPHMESLFKVQIESNYKCETDKVLEVIDVLTIVYNVSSDLTNIIDMVSLNSYNQVFRFLLKVKWGLWTLENLNFSHSYKNRPPFMPVTMVDHIIRRLALIRFWLFYAIQCIHCHLMTQVLQAMGQQLDARLQQAKSLMEIIAIHKSYISTVYEHCFLTKDSLNIAFGIRQLLNLILVLKDEWNSMVLLQENEDWANLSETEELIENSQVGTIEQTYIECHQFLAKTLNQEVDHNNKSHLNGLSAAFSCSLPY